MLKFISLILFINVLWHGHHGKSPTHSRSEQGDRGKSSTAQQHQVTVSA
jgi:hypothetical protein